MNTAGPKAALGDLEAAAFAKDDVGCRDAHIFKQDFGVPVRRVLIAKYLHGTCDRDPRRIQGNEYLRLLNVAVLVIGIGFSHDDENPALFAVGATDVVFLAVDHILVAVTLDGCLDVGGVARGYVWFGHGECRPYFAGEEWFQPLLFLFIIGIP